MINSIPVQRVSVNPAGATTDAVVLVAQSNSNGNGQPLRIRVVGLVLTATVATTVVINSKPAGAGTPISGVFSLAQGIPLVLPIESTGYFETNNGEGLTLTTGAGAVAATFILTAG